MKDIFFTRNGKRIRVAANWLKTNGNSRTDEVDAVGSGNALGAREMLAKSWLR